VTARTSRNLLDWTGKISNPMRGSSFQIITFIGLAASQEEEAFPITTQTYAIRAVRTRDIHKRQTHLVREDVNIRTLTARLQLQKKKKYLVVIFKWLGAKTN
jgi:hypothetical protein